MSAKLQQWRLADHRAHAAELRLRSFGFQSDDAQAPVEDVALARELRHAADRLFSEAMAELQRESNRRVADSGSGSNAH